MEKYIERLKTIIKRERIWLSLFAVLIVGQLLMAEPTTESRAFFYIISSILLISIIINFIILKIPKPPKTSSTDPVRIMIGDNHARDVLGEMYEIAYRHAQKNTPIELEYLIQMQEEVLRRFIETYDLKPIGKPGDGPIAFDPLHHRGNEKLQPGSPVYIVNIGWEREGKTILPALVRTQIESKKGILHGDH